MCHTFVILFTPTFGPPTSKKLALALTFISQVNPLMFGLRRICIFCLIREPCPVSEPDNNAARFWNQLPGSKTGCPIQKLDKHVSIYG